MGLDLDTRLGKFSIDLDGAGEASVVRVFSGGKTTFTVTHNIGILDLTFTVFEISSNEVVIPDVIFQNTNTLDVVFSGNIADNTYRMVIIG